MKRRETKSNVNLPFFAEESQLYQTECGTCLLNDIYFFNAYHIYSHKGRTHVMNTLPTLAVKNFSSLA